MSIPLPLVDLSVYPVGTVGYVSFNNAAPSSSVSQYKTPANIQIYNESGSGLQIAFPTSANGYFIPAGGWLTLPMAVGEPGYNFTVVYTLPNPPVTQLHTTYYAPGEVVPPVAILGNSPIGIGGTIQTSSVQELVNQGNNPLTPIVNVQPNDTSGPTWIADNSGNLTIKADQAGTLFTLLHLIANAITGAASVQLSDASHQTEVLGDLKVDGTSFVGNFQVFGAVVLPYPSVQTLVNNSTVNLNTGPLIVVTESSVLTGIIMTPGSTPGQLIYLYNSGGSSITFATTGSRVRNGANITIGNGQTAVMLWDGTNWSTAYK